MFILRPPRSVCKRTYSLSLYVVAVPVAAQADSGVTRSVPMTNPEPSDRENTSNIKTVRFR